MVLPVDVFTGGMCPPYPPSYPFCKHKKNFQNNYTILNSLVKNAIERVARFFDFADVFVSYLLQHVHQKSGSFCIFDNANKDDASLCRVIALFQL